MISLKEDLSIDTTFDNSTPVKSHRTANFLEHWHLGTYLPCTCELNRVFGAITVIADSFRTVCQKITLTLIRILKYKQVVDGLLFTFNSLFLFSAQGADLSKEEIALLRSKISSLCGRCVILSVHNGNHFREK